MPAMMSLDERIQAFMAASAAYLYDIPQGKTLGGDEIGRLLAGVFDEDPKCMRPTPPTLRN